MHPNELIKSFTGLLAKLEISGWAQEKAANETGAK